MLQRQKRRSQIVFFVDFDSSRWNCCIFSFKFAFSMAVKVIVATFIIAHVYETNTLKKIYCFTSRCTRSDLQHCTQVFIAFDGRVVVNNVVKYENVVKYNNSICFEVEKSIKGTNQSLLGYISCGTVLSIPRCEDSFLFARLVLQTGIFRNNFLVQEKLLLFARPESMKQ